MKRSERLKFRPVVAALEDRRLLAAPITELSIPAGARGIAAGPSGDLWFTLANDQIGRITLDGQVTTFPIPSSHGGPAGITAGPDGNVWFTYAADRGIGRITPGGQYTTFAPGTEPDDIAAGPDGNLWFVDGSKNVIGRITPNGQLTEFTLPTAGSIPYGITPGPDGNFWFTEYGSGKVGRITTDGAITEFPLPGMTIPLDIAAGADGNLWITSTSDSMYNSSSIYRITTTGVSTEFNLSQLHSQNTSGFSILPYLGLKDIAAGPDGSLWFTESAVNAIGRITPAGVVSEFSIPTAGSRPIGITGGPDGNVWFAESHGARIGRFHISRTDLGIAVVSGPVTGTPGQGLSYTITVTNHGPIAATDVMLSEEYLRSSIPLPPPTTGITPTASQGTVSVAPVRAQLGTMASGAKATVTIVVAPSMSFINSRFTVHANESDTNLANDADTFSVMLNPVPPSSSPHVLSLRSIRVKRKGLVAIVINFDQPMNPGALQKVGIYHLVNVGSGKKFRPKVVALVTAKYDAASRSVRLSLKKPVTTGTLRLTVNHSGVIAANGTGLAGGDYVAIVPT